jgi:phosphate/sulfate permease
MYMSLLNQTNTTVITLILFAAMMLSIWIGIKVRTRMINRIAPKVSGTESSGDIGTLTGLLFFLLAFTFGMSGTRYEERREVVLEEGNIIGTALLRADLYPEEERNAFRANFKEYIEYRIAFFESGTNVKQILAADSMSGIVSSRIWQHAARLSKDPNYLAATQQMIPALNDMIDITTVRLAGEKAKVPETIVWMLFMLACASAFFIGYNSVEKGHQDWVVATGFCVLVSIVVYITLDLDRPRRGFINIESASQTIVDLRKNFK